jgi:O-antigen/teichoic acid export membrane protein
LVGTLAGTIWIILFPSLTAIGAPIIAFWIFTPNLVVGAGVTFALFQWMGLNGAAIGMVVSQVLLSASFVLVFKYKYDAKPLDFILLKSADTSGIIKKLKRRLGK